jgi:DNA-binding IclR family transcriptional regulator
MASVLSVLRRWQAEGALWTSDVAHGARTTTAEARRALLALERKGLVRRVVEGNPTSWALAAAAVERGKD